MRRLHGIVTGLLALTTLYMLAHARPAPTAPAAPPDDRAAKAVARRLEALERRPVTTRIVEVAVPSRAAEALEPSAPAEARAVAEDEETSESLEDRLAARFDDEDPDAVRSDAAEAELAEAWAALLSETSVLNDVDCRGSLCRVEVHHDSVEGHEALLQALLSGAALGPGPASVQLEADEDGPLTVAFLGRGDAPADLWP